MIMEQTLTRALAAAARAFADEIERDSSDDHPADSTSQPVAGSRESMIEVLGSVAEINREKYRGATNADMRTVASRAGMDPRGMAGYYNAELLEMRDDGRWITDTGTARLLSLQNEG